MRTSLRWICLTLAVLLLASCGGEPAPVRTVREFHEAINRIEPGQDTGENVIQSPEGFRMLRDIFAKYTTDPQVPPDPVYMTIAAGLVRFTDMEYELTSQSDECAVVHVTGQVTIGENTSGFAGNYVVVKQGRRWLVDLDAESCE